MTDKGKTEARLGAIGDICEVIDLEITGGWLSVTKSLNPSETEFPCSSVAVIVIHGVSPVTYGVPANERAPASKESQLGKEAAVSFNLEAQTCVEPLPAVGEVLLAFLPSGHFSVKENQRLMRTPSLRVRKFVHIGDVLLSR